MTQREEGGNSSPDKWLYFAFIGLFIWLPLPVGSNRAWAWSLMEVWVFGLSIWWLLLFLRNRVTVTPAFLKAKPMFLLFGLWVALLLLQIVPLPNEILAVVSPGSSEAYERAYHLIGDYGRKTISTDPFATIEFLLKSLAYIMIFALALLLLKRTRQMKFLITVVVLSGVFQAVYGSLMVLTGIEYGFLFEKVHGKGVATGTFVNRNHLAGYLEMCLALGLGMLIVDYGEWQASNWRAKFRDIIRWLLSAKMRLRIYLAVMVIGLVLTHSRMGNTAFFTSLLIASIVWLLLASKRPKRSVIILLISILVIDIYIVGSWFGIDKVIERIERTTLDTVVRDDIDIDALEYFYDYPVLGSGAGSFYSIFPRYRQAGLGDSTFYYAHNDYLQFAVETGAIGLCLLGVMTLLSLRAAILAIKRRQAPVMQGLGFAGFMGITAILIHSSVDFNLQIPANAALFMLLLAYSWIGSVHQRRHASNLET